MRKVRINQGRSVPWAFRIVGTLTIVVVSIKSLQGLPEHVAIPVVILVSLTMPLLWFSFNILTIDNDLKKFHSGVFSMGFKTGKPKKFSGIEKIFINKVKTTRKMQSHGTGSAYHDKGVEYRAFIKFDDGSKHFLTSDPNEQILEEKVTKIRQKLGLS